MPHPRSAGYMELRRMLAQRRVIKQTRLPPWSLTFADLMMLLLTFFIMLSSLSEIDKEKYRMLSVSLATELKSRAVHVAEKVELPAPPEKIDQKSFAQWAAASLRQELASQAVEMEQRAGALMLRIHESLAFPTASAEINASFLPVMAKVAGIIEKTEGQIIVAGHTDNVPINTFRFPSNWELSGARAAAVAQALMARAKLPPERFVVEGHADTQPLASNDAEANRAQNRRVEIRIINAASAN